MVFVTVEEAGRAPALRSYLAERGLLVAEGQTKRLVTHLDIDPLGIEAMITACGSFFA